MSYSIRTKDGITINNIPDDIAPDSQSLKDRVAEIRGSNIDKTDILDNMLPNAEATGLVPAAGEFEALDEEPRGVVGTLARQLGLTGRIIGEGATGIVSIASDPLAVMLNKVLPEGWQSSEDAVSTVSKILTDMGVPEPENKAERVVQNAGQALVGGGGIVGAARQVAKVGAKPVTKAVSELIASKPSEQLAGAAMAGGGSQLAEEEGAGVLGQVGAALAGGLAGAKLAAPKAIREIDPIVQEAKASGVRLMTSDVKPPMNFASRWVQTVGERVPAAGTGGARETQQKERVSAVRDFLRNYGADDTAQLSDDVMRDLSKKRSSDIAKYTKLKGEVINKLSNDNVNVSRTMGALDNEIASLKALKSEDSNTVVKLLEDFKTSIQEQPIKNIEKLREQLGQSMKNPNLTHIKNSIEKSTSKIYPKLKQDMGDFIQKHGDRRDVTKWKIADKKLSGMIKELKSTALKSALDKGEITKEVVRPLLFSKKKSDVIRLYKNLTPEGRRNGRAAILQDVVEKAGGIDDINPDRFINQLRRSSTSAGVFFRNDDLMALKGLTNVLKVTRRAQSAAASPSTGVQLTIPVVAAVLGDIMGSAASGIAGGATIGLAARAYESKPVRNILMKLGKTSDINEQQKLITKFVGAFEAAKELKKEGL